MIDLHTHILPNIDDGAGSIEEAIKMTEALYAQNISTAVCTPHFDPTQTSIQEFVNKRTFAMDCLRESKIALIAGSETVLHEYLFHYTDLNKLCFEGTRYLLLELPFNNKWGDNVFKTLEKLSTYYNVIPIIAHIERYQAVKKSEKCIQRLIDMGCAIQLNTSSIIDKKSRRQVLRYMRQGYIDVFGSDCHNMNRRPPVMIAAIDIVTKNLGVEYFEEHEHNAECIVKGIKLREKRIRQCRILGECEK